MERVVSAPTDQSEYFSRKGPSGCALTKVPKARWVCFCVRACVRACSCLVSCIGDKIGVLPLAAAPAVTLTIIVLTQIEFLTVTLFLNVSLWCVKKNE